ncbi:histone-lysine N-methyltransferase 2B [Plutella xylostella]|uniref:histone-lysine N-methyltransferase 2B n=1 Tax=Plutella xylostella TaxID=51655 RepID=UPI0020327EC3|nr:histone-lysine N-methyltransferase 2B [Plutella xylostella]
MSDAIRRAARRGGRGAGRGRHSARRAAAHRRVPRPSLSRHTAPSTVPLPPASSHALRPDMSGPSAARPRRAGGRASSAPAARPPPRAARPRARSVLPRPRAPRLRPLFLWARAEHGQVREVHVEEWDRRNRLRLARGPAGWRVLPRTATYDALAPPRRAPDLEAHIPSHTITVPRRASPAPPPASPAAPTPPPAPPEPTPLDNLLAVAELEFHQQQRRRGKELSLLDAAMFAGKDDAPDDLFETISQAHYLGELGGGDEALLESLVEQGCEDNLVLGLLADAGAAAGGAGGAGEPSLSAAEGLLHLGDLPPPRDAYPAQGEPAYPPEDATYPPPEPTYTQEEPYAPPEPEYPPQDTAYEAPEPPYAPPDVQEPAVYSSPEPGFPATKTVSYQSSETVYPPSETVYPQTETVYPETETVYPETETVYPQTETVYPQTDTVYPPSETVYPPSKPVYPPSETVYSSSDNQYPPSETVYSSSDTVYPPSETVFPPSESEPVYPPSETVFSSGKSDYSAQSPEPVYTSPARVAPAPPPSPPAPPPPAPPAATELSDIDFDKELEASQDSGPTDLSVHAAREPPPREDLPRDLRVRRPAPPAPAAPAAASPPRRAPSRESDAMQSPQPSGIPAVPCSPELPPPRSKHALFLETLLASPSPKMYTSEVTVSKQQSEPLNLGKHRKSASPTVSSCSEERAGDARGAAAGAEPRAKRPRRASHEPPPRAEDSPREQLRQLKLSPNFNLPDPLLVPKDKLGDILRAPAREIAALLLRRPELRLPEAFAFPAVLRDPDILVVSLAQLEGIIENEGKPPERREPPRADAALGSMLWLPYFSHLESAACAQNMDFLKALSAGYGYPPDLQQVMGMSRFLPGAFPAPPADYERLQLAMWQEAAAAARRAPDKEAAKCADVQNPYVHSTKSHKPGARASPGAHYAGRAPYYPGGYGSAAGARGALPGLQIPYFPPGALGSQRSPRTPQQKSPTSPYYPNNNYLQSLKQAERGGGGAQEAPRPRISVKSLQNLLEPGAAPARRHSHGGSGGGGGGRRRDEPPEVGSTTPLGEPPPPPHLPHDPSPHLWHPLFGKLRDAFAGTQPKRLHRPLELDDGDGDGRLTAASARAAARAAALSGPRGVCGVRAAGREPGNGNQPS